MIDALWLWVLVALVGWGWSHARRTARGEPSGFDLVGRRERRALAALTPLLIAAVALALFATFDDSDDEARARYAAFSARHAPAYTRALHLQRLVPALPPRALTAVLKAFHPFVDRGFSWYLDQAHPSFATG